MTTHSRGHGTLISAATDPIMDQELCRAEQLLQFAADGLFNPSPEKGSSQGQIAFYLDLVILDDQIPGNRHAHGLEAEGQPLIRPIAAHFAQLVAVFRGDLVQKTAQQLGGALPTEIVRDRCAECRHDNFLGKRIDGKA